MMNTLNEYCRSKNPQAHAERAVDCRAAGRLLSERGALFEQYVGNLAWLRNADESERPLVRQQIRDEQWQSVATAEARTEFGAFDGDVVAFKAAWMVGGNEADVDRRLMQDRGIPLHAPVDFKVPNPLALDLPN